MRDSPQPAERSIDAAKRKARPPQLGRSQSMTSRWPTSSAASTRRRSSERPPLLRAQTAPDISRDSGNSSRTPVIQTTNLAEEQQKFEAWVSNILQSKSHSNGHIEALRSLRTAVKNFPDQVKLRFYEIANLHKTQASILHHFRNVEDRDFLRQGNEREITSLAMRFFIGIFAAYRAIIQPEDDHRDYIDLSSNSQTKSNYEIALREKIGDLSTDKLSADTLSIQLLAVANIFDTRVPLLQRQLAADSYGMLESSLSEVVRPAIVIKEQKQADEATTTVGTSLASSSMDVDFTSQTTGTFILPTSDGSKPSTTFASQHVPQARQFRQLNSSTGTTTTITPAPANTRSENFLETLLRVLREYFTFDLYYGTNNPDANSPITCTETTPYLPGIVLGY